MAVTATVRAIEALEHKDTNSWKHFAGNLAVRLPPRSSKKLKKVLCFVYYVDGHKHPIVLGNFIKDETKAKVGYLTLAQANAKIEKLADRVNKGDYPHLDKKRKKEAASAAETAAAAKLHATTSDALIPYAEITINEMIAEYTKYINKPGVRASKTVKDKKFVLDMISDKIGTRLAISIKKSEAKSLIQEVAVGCRPGKTSEGMAREFQKTASALYNWKISDEEDDESYANPFARAKKLDDIKRIIGTSKHKEHALTQDEIKQIWSVLTHEAGPCSSSTARALLMTLVTGQRPGEVAGMRRCEIHQASYVDKMTHYGEHLQETAETTGGWWVIPWKRIKTRRVINGSENKVDHLVYLPELAMRIVGDFDDYIFPNPHNLDAPIAEHTMSEGVREERTLPDGTKRPYLGVEKQWRPNDLRRTFRTIIARLGVPKEIGERIINHSLGKVEGIYNLYEYAEEKKTASTLLAEYIDKLTTNDSGPTKIRMNDNKYDIEELRQHVETLPLTKVAALYGVSDNAIKKRCIKNGISLKSQGYWLKKGNRQQDSG